MLLSAGRDEGPDLFSSESGSGEADLTVALGGGASASDFLLLHQ